MGISKDLVELVRDLVFSGSTLEEIKGELRRRSLDSAITQQELEGLYYEARAARGIVSRPSSKFLPRIIGAIAIVLGCFGIWLGTGSEMQTKRSPQGYGFCSLVLGLILVVKPEWSNSKLD